MRWEATECACTFEDNTETLCERFSLIHFLNQARAPALGCFGGILTGVRKALKIHMTSAITM